MDSDGENTISKDEESVPCEANIEDEVAEKLNGNEEQLDIEANGGAEADIDGTAAAAASSDVGDGDIEPVVEEAEDYDSSSSCCCSGSSSSGAGEEQEEGKVTRSNGNNRPGNAKPRRQSRSRSPIGVPGQHRKRPPRTPPPYQRRTHRRTSVSPKRHLLPSSVRRPDSRSFNRSRGIERNSRPNGGLSTRVRRPISPPSPPVSRRMVMSSSGGGGDPHLVKYFFRNARFFMLKSNNHQNVELSKSRGVWSSPPQNEARLNQAYRECKNVILIFSVKESGRFQGFGRLAGLARHDVPPVPWHLPPGMSARALGGVFKIDWICRRELSFSKCSHLYNPWNEGKQVKIGRDGQEIEPRVAEELCRLFQVDDGVDLRGILERIRAKSPHRHSAIATLLHSSSASVPSVSVVSRSSSSAQHEHQRHLSRRPNNNSGGGGGGAVIHHHRRTVISPPPSSLSSSTFGRRHHHTLPSPPPLSSRRRRVSISPPPARVSDDYGHRRKHSEVEPPSSSSRAYSRRGVAPPAVPPEYIPYGAHPASIYPPVPAYPPSYQAAAEAAYHAAYQRAAAAAAQTTSPAAAAAAAAQAAAAAAYYHYHQQHTQQHYHETAAAAAAAAQAAAAAGGR